MWLHIRKGAIIVELIIFSNISCDECVKSIEARDNTNILRHIIKFAEEAGVTQSPIAEYISSLLANDDNIISRLAQSGKKIGDELYKIAKMDLDQIYKNLFSIQIKYSPSGNDTGFCQDYVESIEKLTVSKNSQELLEELIRHYRTLGCGVLSKYLAFKYDGDLLGIDKFDKVKFSELVGLQYQKDILIENTKAFIDGKKANNVLLFGDRGCGKSSSVKALLDMFSSQGLRLIEVPKAHIADIPSLIAMLSEKPSKYILFLDDLSFESHDKDYKTLKVAMEGQLGAKGDNVLIYATSNRRHLVKETWEDREGSDIHKNDQMQQTLSLSERFGISLVFPSPNQREYLDIVKELLNAEGISITAEIEKAAVAWQMDYGSKSGRCAKQFVNNYVSTLQI